jgi:hypothetical protein
MKTKLSIFALLTIAMLLIAPAFAAFHITIPHNADAMWVESYPSPLSFSTATTSVGAKFNITVCLNVTEDVTNWQVALHYNRIQLKCLRALPTASPTSEYMSGAPSGTSFLKAIDTSFLGNGSILASEACFAPEYISGPHSGTLFWAEFEILIGPDKVNTVLTSMIDISTEYQANGAGNTWVHDSSTDTYWGLTCSDAIYTFTWAQPTTNPHMGIEHDNGFGVPMSTSPLPAVWPITWGPSPPNVTGSGFTTSLYIENLDPAWGLWNASFTLSYNSTVIDVLGGLANITIDSNWRASTPAYVPGTITIYVENYTTPSPGWKVLVGTVKFTINIMQASPPLPFGYFDGSMLTYGSVAFFDDPSPGGNLPIPADPSDHGEVRIFSMIALPVPYLKVVPDSTIIGPAPSIGSTFCVDVQVVNMSSHWYDVAVQFRLQYDSAVLSLVSVTKGGFMTDPTWNKYGTFFYSVNNLADPMFGDHVAVISLLLPNDTNGIWDQTTFPNTVGDFGATPAADPTVATVCFEVVAQNCFGLPNITTYLDIPPFWLPTDCLFIDSNLNYIPSNPCLNATVTIVSLNFVGRQIDVYGGAVNDGYGVLVGSPYLQFPAPYGGQGPNHWMDIVFPQSWVYLHANVTYNYWPVQSKDVGFEIEGPFTKLPNGTLVPSQTYQIWAKFTATTDSNGVATYAYRMPWPCDSPDSITGVWKITSTVTIADQVVMDTMIFYYERLVYITSVTTDSYSYYHGEYVKVTVNYQTHSVEYYPALFAIVITDELGVPFGMGLYGTTVGGATFCTWKEDTFTVTIYIPKWAYAGNGYVHVSVYDKDPTIGGEPLAPEFTPPPQINIYPY